MAYFMADTSNVDQKEECRLNPNLEATEKDLKEVGVECTKVDFDSPNVDVELEELIKSYGMNHRDEIRISRETMPEFDTKLKIFFEEHLHDDAELRIIKNGAGYFDVRGVDERWIRIPVRRGDFVFLPAGIYHRFTPDTKEDVTALRLFRNNPKWEAHNRRDLADQQPVRSQYLQSINA